MSSTNRQQKGRFTIRLAMVPNINNAAKKLRVKFQVGLDERVPELIMLSHYLMLVETAKLRTDSI